MAYIKEDHPIHRWKRLVMVEARKNLRRETIDGVPIRCDMTFFFEQTRTNTVDGVHHTAKPDRDNLEKAVKDAITDAGLWRDDSLVCLGEVKKLIGTRPGVEILIGFPLPEEDQPETY